MIILLSRRSVNKKFTVIQGPFCKELFNSVASEFALYVVLSAQTFFRELKVGAEGQAARWRYVYSIEAS